MNQEGLIYFIQPGHLDLINLNIYKIGMCRRNDIDLIYKLYPKDTKILFFQACNVKCLKPLSFAFHTKF